ncbi:hypothetical protein Taro_056463 [Colocasia esculenta]|uniref:Uncharacterized protein n=1 Tax=Colocasia esculenta TaxID=4460 RepID=A0A843XXF4_COLES|nr:hypothetical protein [Colocasia esculenta]
MNSGAPPKTRPALFAQAYQTVFQCHPIGVRTSKYDTEETVKFKQGFTHEKVLKSKAGQYLSTDGYRQSLSLLALCVSVDSNNGSVDRSTQSRNLEFWKACACRQIWVGCRQVAVELPEMTSNPY